MSTHTHSHCILYNIYLKYHGSDNGIVILKEKFMLNTEIKCHDTCKLFLNDSGEKRAEINLFSRADKIFVPGLQSLECPSVLGFIPV